MATIWPTTPDKGEQGILTRFDPETGAGFALAIGSDDGATAILGHGSGAPIRLSVGKALKARTWYRIWASFDRAKDHLVVGQTPISPSPFTDSAGTASLTLEGEVLSDGGCCLLIAASGGEPVSKSRKK